MYYYIPLPRGANNVIYMTLFYLENKIMAVISGVLKGPMGDALEGVVIELRALRTSATVITQERSSSVTNASGRYSLTVEPGDYSVFISAFGRTPENRGSISVKLNSSTGTLNDFLLIPGETDLNPAIVATVDGMRAAAAASAISSKKSADSAAAAMTNAVSKVTTDNQHVASSVSFSQPVGISLSATSNFLPRAQGAWVAWNRVQATPGYADGATEFINHKGTRPGGFNFWNSDGTTADILTIIGATGNITTKGRLSSIGDQHMQADPSTSNLLLRFKDIDGVEKSSIYAQTDTGQLNIRWNGTSNTASFRPDGFIGVSNGIVFGNSYTTAEAVPDFGELPFMFRGPRAGGISSGIPNSINIGTPFGFAVVPTSKVGLADGVERGKPVFSVSALSGIAYVMNDIKIGTKSVLKTGDGGIGTFTSATVTDNNAAGENQFFRFNSNTTGAPSASAWAGVMGGYDGASRFKLAWSMGSTTVDLRTQVRNPAGALSSWVSFRHSGNTTVDANGFIKAASPIIKLFGTGESELNDQSQGVTTERISEGVYRVSGVLGFNSDGAWGGPNGGIGLPKDANDLALVWVDYEVDATGDLLIKTFHRVNSTAPKFAQNVKVGYKEGQPIDIPDGRWIDLRVEMPGGDEPEYEPVPEDEVPEVTPEVAEPEGGEEQAPGETPAPIEEHKE